MKRRFLKERSTTKTYHFIEPHGLPKNMFWVLAHSPHKQYPEMVTVISCNYLTYDLWIDHTSNCDQKTLALGWLFFPTVLQSRAARILL